MQSPQLSGIYRNVILVFSAFIHKCKYKQPNYTESESSEGTEVHVLVHGCKNYIFQKRVKQCPKMAIKTEKRE